MTKINSQNIGNAGEYFIAYILSANNCIVTITLGRNEGFDLLVVNPKNHTTKISVKTTFSKKRGLLMNKKAENIKEGDFFYAFIKFSNHNVVPEYWIVPSFVVADVITESHKKWLNTPRKDGDPHNDTTMRQFYLKNTKTYPTDWEVILKQYYQNLSYILDY